MAEARKIRCAIYTRKSSEEGLEQSFNSLHAQREACEAFIVSQRHEGWHVLPKHYDDGGFSGGNMERPALNELLTDIAHRRIDTVVVYKVDRLTRSLSDFAKIIERFDQNSVSFVSVTQQFNTTSSMGRLTLNVLLSFAQFEREVTGERIRDKIAASKRKGMWMGGIVPLGYDLKNRQLLVNEKEARTVRYIFNTYLRLGCVSALKAKLDGESISSKSGAPFSRGALYHLLRNRLYIGEIPHKGQVHQGRHRSIIDRDLWNKVDEKLLGNIQGEKRIRAATGSLAGILLDEHGNRYTPTHSTKGGKRYRYYTSQGAIRRDREAPELCRIPAHELERLLIHRFSEWIFSPKSEGALKEIEIHPRSMLKIVRQEWRSASAHAQLEILKGLFRSITVFPDHVEAELSAASLLRIADPETPVSDVNLRLTWDVALSAKRGSTSIDNVPGTETVSTALLKMIARSRLWAEGLASGEIKGLKHLTKKTGLNRRYTAKVLRACALAPEIVEAALAGRQSKVLTAQRLITGDFPLSWEKQRQLFG